MGHRAICLVLTGLVVTSEGIGAALTAPGTGELSFGIGLDLVIVMPISWIPLVADYTRYATGPRAAFRRDLRRLPGSERVALCAGSGSGARSGGRSFTGGHRSRSARARRWVPRRNPLSDGAARGDRGVREHVLSSRVASEHLAAGLAPRVPDRDSRDRHGLAGALTMERYEFFLFLLGSVFVPLFAVLAAHHLSRRGSPWLRPAPGSGGSRSSHGSPVSRSITGSAPPGPWWTAGVRNMVGEPLTDIAGTVGASIPTFAVSFLLASALFRGKGKDPV